MSLKCTTNQYQYVYRFLLGIIMTWTCVLLRSWDNPSPNTVFLSLLLTEYHNQCNVWYHNIIACDYCLIFGIF